MRKNYGPFIADLKAFIKRAGSQRAAAESLGIAESYVSDILAGRKPVSGNIAKKLGFEWKLEKVR